MRRPVRRQPRDRVHGMGICCLAGSRRQHSTLSGRDGARVRGFARPSKSKPPRRGRSHARVVACRCSRPSGCAAGEPNRLVRPAAPNGSSAFAGAKRNERARRAACSSRRRDATPSIARARVGKRRTVAARLAFNFFQGVFRHRSQHDARSALAGNFEGERLADDRDCLGIAAIDRDGDQLLATAPVEKARGQALLCQGRLPSRKSKDTR